jgi:regulator of sigma E protease
MAIVESLVTLVLFALILGLLIVIHELGHFLVARLANIRVLEFGIGFPPRARVLRNEGETLWTLNWLPIGGYVKLEGEEGEAGDPRSFAAQRLVTKVAVLVAGVVMNLLLALAIMTGIALTGDPAIGIYVPYVEAGSPAEKAGLLVGDVIERVDGQAYGAFGPGSVLDSLRSRAGEEVVLLVRHADGSADELTARLRTPEEVKAGQGALGIGRAGTHPLEGRPTPDTISYAPDVALRLGVERTVEATGLILGGVGELLTAIITRPTEPPPASGPIGIATQIGDVFWTLGPVMTLYLAGILSANLAVINVLPVPPLDGGRILVLVMKAVFGSRISLRAERLTYLVGFVLLMALLVWLTGFDLVRELGIL